jgi:hypothetical protein
MQVQECAARTSRGLKRRPVRQENFVYEMVVKIARLMMANFCLQKRFLEGPDARTR